MQGLSNDASLPRGADSRIQIRDWNRYHRCPTSHGGHDIVQRLYQSAMSTCTDVCTESNEAFPEARVLNYGRPTFSVSDLRRARGSLPREEDSSRRVTKIRST